MFASFLILSFVFALMGGCADEVSYRRSILYPHSLLPQEPQIVAANFIKQSIAHPTVIKSELMSDCHGQALVYVTTNKVKYKVRLKYGREKNRWNVVSASAFGDDVIENN